MVQSLIFDWHSLVTVAPEYFISLYVCVVYLAFMAYHIFTTSHKMTSINTFDLQKSMNMHKGKLTSSSGLSCVSSANLLSTCSKNRSMMSSDNKL